MGIVIHKFFVSLLSMQITTEKLEELKGNIPRAGPKYRLGMYFETIHNLPCFDAISSHHEDTGYTSYWETDTEVDSDFGNFIFNNVSGDSASLICIDDTVDLIALRKRHEEVLTKGQPHYKLEQSVSPATSPSIDHPLEMSLESKHSIGSHSSRTSQLDHMCDTPPPVPPPRRTSSTTAADMLDHTYETLDDCKGEYLAHNHHETVYISKASDDSRGSQDSGAKPVSNDETDFNHSSASKGAEAATVKSPMCGKPRSSSLQHPKSPDCVNYRQHRKLSESSLQGRKRRLEKVASKGSNYPPPIKGFPAGVPEDYADYLATSVWVSSERRSPMYAPSSPVTPPSQRVGFTSSPERKSGDHKLKQAAPLVIKHKGKTYFVPVVDKKLQKELEKRSKADNPSVTIKQGNLGVPRSNSNASNLVQLQAPRSFASPPKMDPSDHAASHRRRNSSKCSSSPQRVPVHKQVTHYGVL